jgi:hypothetical protein
VTKQVRKRGRIEGFQSVLDCFWGGKLVERSRKLAEKEKNQTASKSDKGRTRKNRRIKKRDTEPIFELFN